MMHFCHEDLFLFYALCGISSMSSLFALEPVYKYPE